MGHAGDGRVRKGIPLRTRAVAHLPHRTPSAEGCRKPFPNRSICLTSTNTLAKRQKWDKPSTVSGYERQGLDTHRAALSPVAELALAGRLKNRGQARAVRKQERASFIMSINQTSPVMFGVVVPVGFLCGVGAFFAFEVGVVFGVFMSVIVVTAIVVILSGAKITITVDDNGVVARSSIFRFPILRVCRSEIASVTLDQASVMRWRGWGYRVKLEGTALIMRGGQAAVIEKTNGKKVLFAVDEAEQLAETLKTITS